MLHHVDLFNRDAGFVARVVVPCVREADGRIFWPDVILWGERVFQRASPMTASPPFYYEAIAVIAYTESEMRERGILPSTPAAETEQH